LYLHTSLLPNSTKVADKNIYVSKIRRTLECKEHNSGPCMREKNAALSKLTVEYIKEKRRTEWSGQSSRGEEMNTA
jgi:hypothetical protein